jgi:anthranilate phosphoribosyltransferase
MFNILGPLLNPARPNGIILGVPECEIGMMFAHSLRDGGVERAMVVCGCEGLDEISPSGPTWVWELKDGQIIEKTIIPDMFGLPPHPHTEVASGTPKQHAEVVTKLLTSGEALPESLLPVLHFALINASAFLVVAGLAQNFKEGVTLEMDSITSGKAWNALEAFRGPQ